MQGEAEDSLGNLKMKETENIRKYNIWFNTLAASTNWDSAALKWAYGQGLAECIKDEMAHLPGPAMLLVHVSSSEINGMVEYLLNFEQKDRRVVICTSKSMELVMGMCDKDCWRYAEEMYDILVTSSLLTNIHP
ncbi:hypothetical protein F5051DRAFT_444971 [Lentinula edodes]|nr:hypothetical protein F5051DRAFT_444971 [Lentinula edodes]